MMLLTLSGSLFTLFPFNKLVKVGSGWTPIFGKIFCNAAILILPSLYIHNHMKQRISAVKKKVFDENRPAFRRFELTGDVLQVRDDYELVDN